MATIAEKLEYLNETKGLIKQAINNKGGNITDSDTFRSYADKINNLEAGGGELSNEQIQAIINAGQPDWSNQKIQYASPSTNDATKGEYTFTQDCYFRVENILSSAGKNGYCYINSKPILSSEATGSTSTSATSPYFRVKIGDVFSWNTPASSGDKRLFIVPLTPYVLNKTQEV